VCDNAQAAGSAGLRMVHQAPDQFLEAARKVKVYMQFNISGG
jgi:hypothetical protein